MSTLRPEDVGRAMPARLLRDCPGYQRFKSEREETRAALRRERLWAALAVLPRHQHIGLCLQQWILTVAECAGCSTRQAYRLSSRASRTDGLGVRPGATGKHYAESFWWKPGEFVGAEVERLYQQDLRERYWANG